MGFAFSKAVRKVVAVVVLKTFPDISFQYLLSDNQT